MRIAIITHNITKQASGQGRVGYELIKYLINKGHFVDIYAEYIPPEFTEKTNIKCFILRTFQRPAIIRTIMFITIVSLKLTLIRLKLAKSYDIIHIDSGCTINSLWNVSTCHYCHTSDIKYEQGVYHKLYTLINSWIEKCMYKNKNGFIVAVSHKMKTDLQKYLKVNSENIKVVYNGVDLNEFNQFNKAKARQQLLQTYNWNPDDFILLFVGDLIRRKGLDLLLDSIREVNTAIKLLIVGHKRQVYIKKTISYGLEDRVKFMGFQKDIVNIYKSVDAFILPSLYDSFGNVVLEAIACGTPVIVSSSAGSSEIIKDGINGIIYHKPHEITEKINLLYNDKNLYNSLSSASRDLSIKYSWSAMAASVEKLYIYLKGKNI